MQVVLMMQTCVLSVFCLSYCSVLFSTWPPETLCLTWTTFWIRELCKVKHANTYSLKCHVKISHFWFFLMHPTAYRTVSHNALSISPSVRLSPVFTPRLWHVNLHQTIQPLPEREGHVLQTGGCGFYKDEERVGDTTHYFTLIISHTRRWCLACGTKDRPQQYTHIWVKVYIVY